MTITNERVGNLEVLDPVAAIAAKSAPLAARLLDLNGRKIGLWSNAKPGADIALEEARRLLEERFQNLKFEKFHHNHPHTVEVVEEAAKTGCDAIIGSTAD